MLRRGVAFVICAALALLIVLPASVEARGRSRGSSPFVTTPFGVIPKSVYYAPYMDPQSIMRFRAAEEAYYKKTQGKNGGSTATKPSTTTKKK
jgi:hypothetical protein